MKEGGTRRVIGVTGQMASGKNFCCDLLEKHGYVSIDADKIVHDAVNIEKDKIVAAFSWQAKENNIAILTDDGKINRKELAKIVFKNDENLKTQEAIIHPFVNQKMCEFIEANKDKIVILNATVLYKTEIAKKCGAIIFVTAPFIVRFFRAKKRDKLPNSQILRRFWAQKHLFAKYNFLNTDIYKVRNLCSAKKLEKKLLKILANIGYEGN